MHVYVVGHFLKSLTVRLIGAWNDQGDIKGDTFALENVKNAMPWTSYIYPQIDFKRENWCYGSYKQLRRNVGGRRGRDVKSGSSQIAWLGADFWLMFYVELLQSQNRTVKLARKMSVWTEFRYPAINQVSCLCDMKLFVVRQRVRPAGDGEIVGPPHPLTRRRPAASAASHLLLAAWCVCVATSTRRYIRPGVVYTRTTNHVNTPTALTSSSLSGTHRLPAQSVDTRAGRARHRSLITRLSRLTSQTDDSVSCSVVLFDKRLAISLCSRLQTLAVQRSPSSL